MGFNRSLRLLILPIFIISLQPRRNLKQLANKSFSLQAVHFSERSFPFLRSIYNINTMIISSFATKTPPAPYGDIIKGLFEQRLHRKFKVDKSDFSQPAQISPEALRREYSQPSQQSNFGEEESSDIILKEFKPAISPPLKQKLIKKELDKNKYTKQQRTINKRYNHYLINYLHKTNLILIKDCIPPNYSVLQSVDDGDYIENDEGTLYERKDYPHNSNVIAPVDLPVENTKTVFQKHFLKMRPEERIFQIDDNSVLKLRQIYQFVGTLFRRSIQFSKKMKKFRSNSQQERKQQTENHDFEAISQSLGIHFRTAKLLYDILNSFYDFQREMLKGEDSKIRASSEIKQSLREILAIYHSNEAVHIPHQELYISLRELRQLLTQKMLQQNNE